MLRVGLLIGYFGVGVLYTVKVVNKETNKEKTRLLDLTTEIQHIKKKIKENLRNHDYADANARTDELREIKRLEEERVFQPLVLHKIFLFWPWFLLKSILFETFGFRWHPLKKVQNEFYNELYV